jgi:hypothetical protein
MTPTDKATPIGNGAETIRTDEFTPKDFHRLAVNMYRLELDLWGGISKQSDFIQRHEFLLLKLVRRQRYTLLLMGVSLAITITDLIRHW